MKKKLVLSMLLAFAGQQAYGSSVIAELQKYEGPAKELISKIRGQLTTANLNKIKAAATKAVNSNERKLLAVGEKLLPYGAFILNNYGTVAVAGVQKAFSTVDDALEVALEKVPELISEAESFVPQIKRYAKYITQYGNMIEGYVNDISGVVNNLSTDLANLQGTVDSLMSANGMTAPANLDDAVSGIQALIVDNLDAIKAVAASAEKSSEAQYVLGMIQNLGGLSQVLYTAMYYAKYYVNFVNTDLVGKIQPAAASVVQMAGPIASHFGVSSNTMNKIQQGVNNLPTYMNDVEKYLGVAYNEAGKVYGLLSSYAKEAGINLPAIG